jgi:hypothetical protein
MEKTKKKSSLILYLLVGMILLSGIYSALQYMIFTKTYENNFLKTTHLLEKNFRSSLESYKVALLEFAKEIKRKNLFAESQKLSELFERSYTYGLGDGKGAKLHLSAVNWVGKGEMPTVGRFGALLYKLDFNLEYLDKLKRYPGQLEISNVISENTLTNLGIGVEDEHETYRGFINARIHTQTLLEGLIMPQVQVVLLDQKAQILATSLNLERDEKQGLNEILQNQGTARFSKLGYIFARNVPLKEYPYALLFGYSSKDFYIKFFDILTP